MATRNQARWLSDPGASTWALRAPITRNGRDLADRYPLAAEAIEALPVRSCVIDGEAIVCDDNGLAVFNPIRGHGSNGRAVLCAFDLLEAPYRAGFSALAQDQKPSGAGCPAAGRRGLERLK